MKAITTKYLCCTEQRGSRIKASEKDGNQITVSYRDELNSDENHAAAAEALCRKLGWTGRLVGGFIKGGMAFVFVDGGIKIVVK